MRARGGPTAPNSYTDQAITNAEQFCATVMEQLH